MNKKCLVEKVAERTGFMKKDVEVMTDALLDSIAQTLAKNEKVQFVGFGTFEVRTRAARQCKNPRTGEMIKIGATKNPAFKAGKNLKKAIETR
ncbi:HU family DNA-binding protein [Christensenella timonensis]|uniref:HU family DNA-binding protein n=1 Tax=Christensenella timonensis TaxID=1816678 RepID=UPI00082F8051|nr:HU family DNA-binding protein [Christensenella timonensis]